MLVKFFEQIELPLSDVVLVLVSVSIPVSLSPSSEAAVKYQILLSSPDRAVLGGWNIVMDDNQDDYGT